VDYIKMDLNDMGYLVVDWIHLSHGSFCEHGNEPSGSIKRGEFLDQLSGEVLKDFASWSWMVEEASLNKLRINHNHKERSSEHCAAKC
jgi:hypothetical protein